jgi:predicted dehydrogenase
MKTLRAALIGLGRIGWQYHLPNLARHEGFEPVAVVDPLAERREEARASYGVAGFEDHRSMLAAASPDLVVIASPTPFHVEQALDAFAAGCDVFCDKPVAASLADTDRMLAAASDAGRKFMAYQPHRTHVECVALLDILSRDLIGPVYMVKAASTRWRRRNDWQAWRANGGGMLYNYGAHMIDQLLYVTASTARTVSCSLRSIASLGDADDVVKAVVETAGGAILDMDINQAAAWPVPVWHVFGERGGAVYSPEETAWRVHYHLPGELEELSLQEGFAAEGREYKVGEITDWREEVFPVSGYQPIDFYAKCHEYFALDKPPFVSAAETRELMRVLDLCARKAAEGCWP